ncbi:MULTISPECIES: hypothetical protein [Thermoanaerobacterium]|uniref:hypothetical protein n=1 Tax=Thermoanaerobacterium TaxID=28895 RepID=UPI000304CA46|nr:hypothetical protein [Thermoanaerobacterium xylanolyticum]
MLLFILIICFFILLFLRQIQAISIVIYEGHTVKITSLHFNNIGRPLTVVNAIDSKGNKNIYFINQIHFFNPHLEYVVNSKDGISSEDAISIVNNNKLCDEIWKIELKHETTENPRKELVYWEILTNKYSSYPMIFIDFYTGKYKVIDKNGKVIKSNM